MSMNIHITDTKEIKNLELISPDTGIDFVKDFIGNHGAFADGQFIYDEDYDQYRCNKETFLWWDKVIDDMQDLLHRIREFEKEYGKDVVAYKLEGHGDCDLEDYAAKINKLLDEEF